MRIVFFTLLAVLALFASDVSAASLQAAHHVVTSGMLHTLHVVLFGHDSVTGVPILIGFAALGTGNLTLADWAKRLDPDGKVPTVVELLTQTNEVLLDMMWREGNLPTGHRTTVRTGLPTVAWRLLNQGITPSKSTTTQIDEQCGILEAWSEVDKDLLLLNGNAPSFRLSESKAFIEAMNQEMVRVLFYGNSSINPEQFTGLSPRYSDSTAPNGTNVIKCGGAGNVNASIWLICWGEETVSGIFPKGSKAGLLHDDFGEQTAEVTAGLPGSRMRVMQERFQWKPGIAVKDWRYAVRCCNIDVTNTDAANIKTIITNMETAVMTPPNRLGKPVFYMNRTMARLLRREARESVGAGGGLTYENFDGERILSFGQVPVRLVDQLLNTEATVA